jgi:hypothetical protein
MMIENDRIKASVWSQRFVVSAILQGSLIIVLTSSGIAIQLMMYPLLQLTNPVPFTII